MSKLSALLDRAIVWASGVFDAIWRGKWSFVIASITISALSLTGCFFGAKMIIEGPILAGVGGALIILALYAVWLIPWCKIIARAAEKAEERLYDRRSEFWAAVVESELKKLQEELTAQTLGSDISDTKLVSYLSALCAARIQDKARNSGIFGAESLKDFIAGVSSNISLTCVYVMT